MLDSAQYGIFADYSCGEYTPGGRRKERRADSNPGRIEHIRVFRPNGEVLLPKVEVSTASPATITATANVQWTFPLAFGEVVWSDGNKTFTQTFPLTEPRPFSSGTFTWKIDAKDWKWTRVAVWDVAGNGAFINPVRR